MLHRSSVIAMALAAVIASPSLAEIVTLPIDTANSAANVNVKVYLSTTLFTEVNVATAFNGHLVLDVSRGGGGEVTGIRLLDSDDNVGNVGLEPITGVIVNLGALGVVPAQLLGVKIATAIQNLIPDGPDGNSDPDGFTLTDDSALPVAFSFSDPNGDKYTGNIGGQDVTVTSGQAILGPATGPIGDILDPVDQTTEVNLVNPVGPSTQLGAGVFTINDGDLQVDDIVLPVSVFLDNILDEPTFLLFVDITISGTIRTVPEASTVAMLGVASAFVGIAGLRRYRRKSA